MEKHKQRCACGQPIAKPRKTRCWDCEAKHENERARAQRRATAKNPTPSRWQRDTRDVETP